MRHIPFILLVGLASLASAQSMTWTLKATTGPSPRCFSSMAYDAKRGVVVLHGGDSAGWQEPRTKFGDTWEWDGTTWTPRAVNGPGPGTRSAAPMCYDSVRERVVLFGGYDNARGMLQDTWTWDGTTWQQVATTGPSPRIAPNAMCFDSARRVAVLYGGSTGYAQVIGETWEWNGLTWNNRNSSSPHDSFEFPLVFDSVRNVALLIRARNPGMWTWNGSQWSQWQGTEPPVSYSPTMVFDSNRGRGVLFGGYYSGTLTWEWDGTAWSSSAIPGPAARWRHMMAFDSRRNVAVLFGGITNDYSMAFSDTWEYGPPCTAPVATTQPTSQTTCAGVPVSFTAAFSGTSPSLQWRKDGVNLAGVTGSTLNLASPTVADAGVYECVATNACGTAISQSASLTVLTASAISVQPQPQTLVPGGDAVTLALTAQGASLAFQWRRNGTPLASGGRISGTTTSSLTINAVAATDQGTYDCLVTGSCGSVVSNPATLTVSTCPVGWTGATTAPFGTRNVHAQAYAAVNAGTLLFGGTTPANTPLGDTWLLRAGTWSQVASTGPAARAFVAMAPLPNGRVLLFGGQTVVNSVASSQGDTWEWNGTAWNRLNVPGPSARAGHSMVLDTVRNRVVLFGGLDASGVSRQDTWEWNGSAWTQVATSGPPGNFGQASAFDPVRGETLIFGGAGSGSSQTWAWNGTSWRQAATTGIVARNYPAMAFDESLGRILLFGGFEGGANVRGDAYLWTGSAWTPSGIGSPPSPRWKHGLSFDRTANAMVITAGTGYGQVPLSDLNVLASGPQPTGQPADASLVPGGVATFTFGVSGGSVAYRWHRNGTPLFDAGSIGGAAYPTLTISSVNAADQGVYHCVATGPCGSITSRTATLTCRPVISQQPAGGTYVGGQPVTLAVVATGGGGATYRWRKDGVNLFNGITYAGVTTPTLTITADEPSQSGDYSVVITNACGTAVSDIATVEVTCPADFNGDGGTDGQDLFDFFEAWSGGESNADLNFDGGIDGGDVTAFYVRWENGC